MAFTTPHRSGPRADELLLSPSSFCFSSGARFRCNAGIASGTAAAKLTIQCHCQSIPTSLGCQRKPATSTKRFAYLRFTDVLRPTRGLPPSPGVLTEQKPRDYHVPKRNWPCFYLRSQCAAWRGAAAFQLLRFAALVFLFPGSLGLRSRRCNIFCWRFGGKLPHFEARNARFLSEPL